MIKKVSIVIIAIALSIAFILPIADDVYAGIFKTIEVVTGITINIDGKDFVPKDVKGNEVEIFGYNGTTYVPIRAISNIYNADINWDSDTNTVLLENKKELINKKPKLEIKDQDQLILIPANPEKGFNFPYVIKLPGKKNKIYSTKNNFLFFRMMGSGIRKQKFCINHALYYLDSKNAFLQIASNFGFPIIMPVIERTGIFVKEDKFGKSMLYEHALSRDSVYVKELTTTDSHAENNIKSYNLHEVDYKKYYDLDDQIAAMIKDAIYKLNTNNIKVEDKVIMEGYSASGTFCDRFTMLHPELVKMLITGATLDDVMLPMDAYKGNKLYFPIGTADYKKITGRDFDLEANNKIAKLIYMGEKDTNNTVLFNECYSEYHMKLIPKLFGKENLPRAKKMMELYKEANGKTLLILDKGIKHAISTEMLDYIKTFIKANADSDVPVYPGIDCDQLIPNFCNITPDKKIFIYELEEIEKFKYDGKKLIPVENFSDF